MKDRASLLSGLNIIAIKLSDMWQVKSLDLFIFLKYILSSCQHRIEHLCYSKPEINLHFYSLSFDNCVFMVWLSFGTKVSLLVWGKDHVWLEIQLEKCPVVSPLQIVELHLSLTSPTYWYENLHMYRSDCSDYTDLVCRNVKYQHFAPVTEVKPLRKRRKRWCWNSAWGDV